MTTASSSSGSIRRRESQELATPNPTLHNSKQRFVPPPPLHQDDNHHHRDDKDSSKLLPHTTTKHKRRRRYSNERLLLAVMILVVLGMGVGVVGMFRYISLPPPLITKTSHQKQPRMKRVGNQMVQWNDQGEIIHAPINKVSIRDLQDLPEEYYNNDHTRLNSNDSTVVSWSQALEGREPLVQLLQETGVEVDTETLALLPKWTDVVDLYGDKPVILGLDQCAAWRRQVPLSRRRMGLAGLFNTGTNLLALYLKANCRLSETKEKDHGGIYPQVPWGKHFPASYSHNHTITNSKRYNFSLVNREDVLPVVLVRDPYRWMQSLCKTGYAAAWQHTPDHCPNLVPDERDAKHFKKLLNPVQVRVKYDLKQHIKLFWDSLAHLWSDWNLQYYHWNDHSQQPQTAKSKFRLMVRMEDLIFHPKQVVQEVCSCAGGVLKEPDHFVYMVSSSKHGEGHKEGVNRTLVSAMILYGTAAGRLKSMSQADLQLAHEVLDPELMKVFQYNVPLVDE